MTSNRPASDDPPGVPDRLQVPESGAPPASDGTSLQSADAGRLSRAASKSPAAIGEPQTERPAVLGSLNESEGLKSEAAAPKPVRLSDSAAHLLLGAAGSGMKALAEILRRSGTRVCGMDHEAAAIGNLSNVPGYKSDPNSDCVDPIEWQPWEPARIPTDTRCCIRSLAVAETDPVVVACREKGIPVLTLQQALGRLTAGRRQIGIAGTHGKSTTTALLHHILTTCGTDAGLFLGAERIGHTGSGGHPGSADEFVLECCEYRRAFRSFSPDTLCLTGIERDHFDCFPEEADEDEAFAELLGTAGTVLFRPECQRSAGLVRRVVPECRRLPFTPETVFGTTSLRQAVETAFAAHSLKAGKVTRETPLSLSGSHNRRNMLAAVATACAIGVPPASAASAVFSFPGLKRRLEYRGLWRGTVMVDDFAHHPTAVRETLAAVRSRWPDHRLTVVFEPHQRSRLARLLREFAESLMMSDSTLIVPVFAARENASDRERSRDSGVLVRTINRMGGHSLLMPDFEQVVSKLKHSAGPGHVVVTLGAGRISCLHDRIAEPIRRNSAA